MKKLILALIMAMAPSIAFAQSSQRNPCYYNLNGGCTNVPTSSSIDDPISGSVAATGDTVTIPLTGRSTVGLSVSGTWSGALTIRASVDYSTVGAASATWLTTTAVPVATGISTTAITSGGLYQINAAGFSAIQVYGTAIVSGRANIALLSSSGVSTIMADNPIPVTPSIVAVSHASTTALASSLSVKASSGNLLGYNCTSITGGSAGFCVAYNGSSTPGTGALTGSNVLDFCYYDTTARGCSLSRIPVSVLYSSGIQILVTSAASPYTYTTGVNTAAISADYQ